MCRNPSTKKTSERIMIVVGSDARKVVMEEFSWWHVKGASIRFNRRLEIWGDEKNLHLDSESPVLVGNLQIRANRHN